jgi:hypothetical protein
MSSQDIKTSFKINLKLTCISSMFLVYLATETFVYGLFPVIIIQFSLFSNVYSLLYLGLRHGLFPSGFLILLKLLMSFPPGKE